MAITSSRQESSYESPARHHRDRWGDIPDSHIADRTDVVADGNVEAHLAGHPEVRARLVRSTEPILPAAIISGLIFAGCTGLFIFIHRIDAEVKSDERRN
jgi:hypothetical protein